MRSLNGVRNITIFLNIFMSPSYFVKSRKKQYLVVEKEKETVVYG